MSHSDEMAELCEGIAEVLKDRGHTTRTLEDKRGVCLLGAGRLAQDSNHDFAVRRHPLGPTLDKMTANALGFDTPTGVVQHNDGHTTRFVKVVEIPHNLVFLKDAGSVQWEYTTQETVTVEEVHPPINQQQAIDLAMDRAKYWRNQ